MHIQLPIKQQHIVTFILGCFYITVLLFRVIGVQVNYIAVLVGLVRLHKGFVLIIREILAIGILEQIESGSLVIKLVIGKHTV